METVWKCPSRETSIRDFALPEITNVLFDYFDYFLHRL